MGGFLVSAVSRMERLSDRKFTLKKGPSCSLFSFEHKVVEYDTQPGSRIDLAVE